VNGDFKNATEVSVNLPGAINTVLVTPENQNEKKYLRGTKIKLHANSAVVIIEK